MATLRTACHARHRSGCSPVGFLLHRLGYRFRLHAANLPGKPDIVLARHRKVVFVHGCFWHRHGVCRALSVPASNSDFWAAKFADNVRRDGEKVAALREAGWGVLVVWECETKDRDALEQTLRAFLNVNAAGASLTSPPPTSSPCLPSSPCPSPPPLRASSPHQSEPAARPYTSSLCPSPG